MNKWDRASIMQVWHRREYVIKSRIRVLTKQQQVTWASKHNTCISCARGEQQNRLFVNEMQKRQRSRVHRWYRIRNRTDFTCSACTWRRVDRHRVIDCVSECASDAGPICATRRPARVYKIIGPLRPLHFGRYKYILVYVSLQYK